jgi:hypothetical protein
MNLIKCLIVFLLISLFSCSTNNPVNTSSSSEFTLKYEIRTSVPVTSNLITLLYTNGTGQYQLDQSFVSGNVWSKEVTVTTPNRPFFAFLNWGSVLSTSGTATGKIYVNGQEVASVTNPTDANNSGFIQMSYPIN